jgi:hypothetical protein
VFEVAEDRARSEPGEHLFVQRTLSRMGHVMNGKTRDDRVKRPKVRGQGEIQVVSEDADPGIGCEATPESFEHRLGKV